MSPAACSVTLQQQCQVSDTAFRGTQVMAEPHWLHSRGHLRGRLSLILNPSPTLCNPACSGCPGTLSTSAKSCFPQRRPMDERFLRKPSISWAETEVSLYQGNHDRLARDWALNSLNFISLTLFTPYFMHNGCFLYRDDLAEVTSILKWIARLLKYGQGCKCLVFHIAKWCMSQMPLFQSRWHSCFVTSLHAEIAILKNKCWKLKSSRVKLPH